MAISLLSLTAKTKKKAAQASAKIYHQTIKQPIIKRSLQAGFTLLEVVIVVAIIAAIVTLVLPRLGNKNNELRATIRKISVLSRDLRSRAKLQNATYRLVISMTEEERKPIHEYWVEKATGQVLNNYDPKNPPSLAKTEEEKKEEAEKNPSPFSPDTRMMKEPVRLPTGLTFESIELGSVDAPITTGIVYIHYLPTGFADEAAIHLSLGEKSKWTLAVHPLTGRVDIIDSFKKLEDLRAQ